jgi:prephenate dehydrogenase
MIPAVPAPEAHVRIGIAGIGLIGSSLARALASSGIEVRVFDANPDYIAQLRNLEPRCKSCATLAQLADGADIIFVCTPVKAVAGIVAALVPLIGPDTVITDVGSAKAGIIRDVAAACPGFTRFVPGHPMAGGEASGPLASHAGLFAGKRYLLTPGAETSPGAVARVEQVLASTGALVSVLDPTQHDRIMAVVSHLPHLYAFALVNAASAEAAALGIDVLKYAGGGFTDVTRIAAADARMWMDIFVENDEFLLHAYELVKQQMEALLRAIEKRDEASIAGLIEAARAARLILSAETQK